MVGKGCSSIQLIFFMYMLPVMIGVLAVLGLMYWVDVQERPNAQKAETMRLDGLGELLIYYPKSMRLGDPENQKHIEAQFTPTNPSAPLDVLVLDFKESSKYIELTPSRIEMDVSSGLTVKQEIPITTYDLDFPPANVPLTITAGERSSEAAEEQSIRLTIDNTIWRIAAGLAVVSAVATFLGVVVPKLFRKA